MGGGGARPRAAATKTVVSNQPKELFSIWMPSGRQVFTVLFPDLSDVYNPIHSLPHYQQKNVPMESKDKHRRTTKE